MVKFAAIALFFFASALSVQACTYCQCEFGDGGHCCVYSDASAGNLDCTAICGGAHRADGSDNGGDNPPGTACAAGGKYECISPITAIGRTACYTQ
ncbi:hypothetical protein SBOR_3539 [Sclerotinia borealis F-4128]|uniref:Uncharacterized protein n=1 Tax=Sclerotinia borealis (strain F-4128) TaxID=1432307 RepID=W9CH44_SCLBF|nr:hypothetical protein SBOR_3539 [Sclerotinia borealis F-4128]